jgi:hypothetical protein
VTNSPINSSFFCYNKHYERKIMITPQKPVYQKGFFEYMIWLKKDQVDYGNLNGRKELRGFREQSFRHITIIGEKTSEEIKKALDRLPAPERKKKITRIISLLKSFKWQYSGEGIYFVEKKKYLENFKTLEHRKAYIRLIKMPDMDIFYRKLNALLGARIPAQIPHITLFTTGEHPSREYFGISIPSKQAFKKLKPKKIK